MFQIFKTAAGKHSFRLLASHGASTFTLLDRQGESLETLHLANTPEEGKATIFARVSQQVERLKARYPHMLF